MVMDINKLIDEYQCPGCVCGYKTHACNRFELESGWNNSDDSKRCKNHVVGTAGSGTGHFFLGMPKGFMRYGWDLSLETLQAGGGPKIWIFPKMPAYTIFNVPVWAAEYNGDLLIRVYMPRINQTAIHVIHGAKFSDLPTTLGSGCINSKIDAPFLPINVTEAIKEMD